MELLTIDNAKAIRNLILNANIIKDIKLESYPLQLEITINGVSSPEENLTYNTDLKDRYFTFNNNLSVMKIKNKYYKMFIHFGEWGYNTRIPNAHLCLGTQPKKFGTDYFAQIELSQALEDNDNIYIVKNLSKLAGNGAITRINSGLGSNKEKKFIRREMLVEKLNKEVIIFDNHKWLCLEKILKKELYAESCHDGIFRNFICEFIRYALTIEETIFEEKTRESRGVIR